jgi:hypothetical protein
MLHDYYVDERLVKARVDMALREAEQRRLLKAARGPAESRGRRSARSVLGRLLGVLPGRGADEAYLRACREIPCGAPDARAAKSCV